MMILRHLVCLILILVGGVRAKLDVTLKPATFNNEGKAVISNALFSLVWSDCNKGSSSHNYTVDITASVDHDIVTIEPITITIEPIITTGYCVSVISHRLDLSATGINSNVTGDLQATFSCTSDLSDLCDGSPIPTPVKIYTETKKLNISSTYQASIARDPSFYMVTINVSKDLATLEKLTLRVSLTSLWSEPATVYSKDVTLNATKGSNTSVVFASVLTDVYGLSIECASTRFCQLLNPWIVFPQRTNVEAHEPYGELVQEMNNLRTQNDLFMSCVDMKCDRGKYINTTDCWCEETRIGERCNVSKDAVTANQNVDPFPAELSSSGHSPLPDKEVETPTTEVETPTTEVETPTTEVETPPTTDNEVEITKPEVSSTRYMEVAVGGLIAILILSLLGYLLYHYRVQVKEWVCSNKSVVSNLPRSLPHRLQRSTGGKYTKLPRTMQEALHQD